MICEETRLTNYLINILRHTKRLRKVAIEYKFLNNTQSEVKPDILIYLIDNHNNPRNYSIFEIKHKTSDLLDSIHKQYSKYMDVKSNNFDPTILPKIDQIPIFINLIFYDTSQTTISHMLTDINFRSEDGVLSYNSSNRYIQMNIDKHSSDPKNEEDISEIANNANVKTHWECRLIPFTKSDLLGIDFKESQISIDPKVSINILNVNLQTFIFRGK